MQRTPPSPEGPLPQPLAHAGMLQEQAPTTSRLCGPHAGQGGRPQAVPPAHVCPYGEPRRWGGGARERNAFAAPAQLRTAAELSGMAKAQAVPCSQAAASPAS